MVLPAAERPVVEAAAAQVWLMADLLAALAAAAVVLAVGAVGAAKHRVEAARVAEVLAVAVALDCRVAYRQLYRVTHRFTTACYIRLV